MYAAILAPLFWVRRLKITPKGFQWLILMMWGFHTLSACFGVLQVYFPGQFQPYLSTAIQNSTYGGENLLITLANGAQVYRPMGLTDRPGGAGNSGVLCPVVGVGIALRERNEILRVALYGQRGSWAFLYLPIPSPFYFDICWHLPGLFGSGVAQARQFWASDCNDNWHYGAGCGNLHLGRHDWRGINTHTTLQLG
jgi:hypothetical protein